jgi:hypothetical protein
VGNGFVECRCLIDCNDKCRSVNARLTNGFHLGCSSKVDSFLGRKTLWEKRKREPTMARTAKKKAAPRRQPAKRKMAAKRAGSARRKPAAKRAARKSPARRKAKAA